MAVCFKCLVPVPLQDAHYGIHEECFTAWFHVAGKRQFTSLMRRHSGSDVSDKHYSGQNSSFFHGKFKKYSAELGGASYIIKMREPEAPELPEVEYLCNQIGALIGIPVAEHFYLDFHGERVFVTKNFISRNIPANLLHIYHFRTDNQHDCTTLMEIIRQKTVKPIDEAIFVDVLIFDALIGNHDRHGRNLAFVNTAESTRLAPIYDNVSYLGLEHGPMLQADFNPLGKIATSKSPNPSMGDYVEELLDLGFEWRLKSLLEKIAIEKVNHLIHTSFCSDLMKKAFSTLVMKRHKELMDALTKR